jgi:hypothetical protein
MVNRRPTGPTTVLLYLAGLQPQSVEWLWRHRLAAGLPLVSASPPKLALNSISAFVAPKTENQVPGGGIGPIRGMSTRRSTRQDAQINCLSTLSIFMKQTTYLATLPNPNLKANECYCLSKVFAEVIDPVSALTNGVLCKFLGLYAFRYCG